MTTATIDDVPVHAVADEPTDAPAARTIDPAQRTVELDARVLRKLVVSTVLDLGDESGSVPAFRARPLPDDGSL